jgi:glucose-6-phosphate isomerase
MSKRDADVSPWGAAGQASQEDLIQQVIESDIRKCEERVRSIMSQRENNASVSKISGGSKNTVKKKKKKIAKRKKSKVS